MALLVVAALACLLALWPRSVNVEVDSSIQATPAQVATMLSQVSSAENEAAVREATGITPETASSLNLQAQVVAGDSAKSTRIRWSATAADPRVATTAAQTSAVTVAEAVGVDIQLEPTVSVDAWTGGLIRLVVFVVGLLGVGVALRLTRSRTRARTGHDRESERSIRG
ncbi:hypothetical protein [Ornithinimicrobium sp. INDO-MA30-4]|uniref:hypothetical protein n=1 Tax=Ornithinimicrobium sp. INDO-MA30-4 TaxID=2908651 RepID=UPI001F3DBF67|nr:hypothetical protein [Ornithinimicrobium sp. INDO-MA30-4]UJH70056.1 hypothetical protein L0A91_12745 [Ornithinimicrobium sp. INDO-MA30-4]